MQNFLNLSLKTKIDLAQVNPIHEDPQEYSEQPFQGGDDYQAPMEDQPLNPTFNIDAFVDEENDVFHVQKNQ